MLLKIDRQKCFQQYSVLPWFKYDFEKDEELFFYPESYGNYILTLPSKTVQENAKAIGREATRLAKALNANKLIFIGDHDGGYRRQYNDHKPAKNALVWLTKKGIGKHFNGGIVADIRNIPPFIRNLSHLSRCNAAFPNVYFTDPKQKIVGNICKYGNLHFSTLSKSSDEQLRLFMKKSLLEYGGEESCRRSFKTTGRKTI